MIFFLVLLVLTVLAWLAGRLGVYFIAVFPANVHNALQGLNVQGLPASDWYYWVRLGFQPLAVWWALFCSGLIDWPRHHRPATATGTAAHS